MHDQIILESSLESSQSETANLYQPKTNNQTNRHQWTKLLIILLERSIGILWTSVILKFYRLLIRSITIALSAVNDRFSYFSQLNIINTINNTSTNHHHNSANSLHCITLIVIVLCFIFLYLATKTYLQVIDYLYSSPLTQIPATVINDLEKKSRPIEDLFNKNDDNDNNRVFGKQHRQIDKHGIHIIVGQYMGKSFPWNKQPNLTNDILNSNNYSPLPFYGDNGSPVYLPKMDSVQAKRLFSINQFNIMASDLISVNRSLPDVRRKACRSKNYRELLLPKTSIIIVFHNEAWSTLVRTVHSAILRSSKSLIEEIILVDDASQRKFLAKELDDYMEKLSNETGIVIKILRSKNRIGLIRARIMGADIAHGEVLTFLDAHCECTKGWLEPLLHRIYTDGKIVVCPIIDIINDHNFAYIRSFESHVGSMNWALNFRWFSLAQDELRRMRKKNYDTTSPFRTPIMAGGLFSIRRDFFYQLGTYDSHLEVWGGENIEMSLRIWQCGGKVEIVPCSHVGHIFRSSSPYSFGKKQVGDVLYSNLIRVAEVWLDEWKYFYYALNPTAKRIISNNRAEILENIEERINLRKKLKCHSFEWFLEHVWIENFFPTRNNTFGQIQSDYSKDCVQRPSNGANPTGKVVMSQCSIGIYGPQAFIMPLIDIVGFIKTDESVCLDVSSIKPNSAVILIACSQYNRQRWRYESNTKRIVHIKTGLCLTIDRRKSHLTISECTEGRINKRQRWIIIEQEWHHQ